ncbi:phosphotransferase family protein [Microlunatus sp. GCM10028923]|uniref:phosphotransferase family protein n=1 Tax=Microlunatus sp. GCM10028923 TaxID=3273400 RepID=UPI00360ECFB9
MNAQLPPPIPRLDPARLIAALAAQHGIHLELIGTAADGEVGAAYVRWPDGRDGVLTTVGDDDPATGDRLRETADMLELARSHGLPVPRYDLVAAVPEPAAHVVVQERLPGAPPQTVDPILLDRMVAETDRWAGLLADRPAEPLPLYLTGSGPGFCLHESLERYDQRTRRLLAVVHEIGQTGPDVITGDDLVHLDFHAGNLLVDPDGRITGIVDWDGWARGDRGFALVVLAYDLAWRRSDPAVRARLAELINLTVPPDRRRRYDASLSLRQVDWSIRHHGRAEVDFWLDVAADRLDPC